MSGIFEKIRCNPQQLRTVAERRYDDADYLRKSKKNIHANGVLYLGGFVLECLLKAKLLETYPWLKSPVNLSKRARNDQKLHRLCYQRHDLAAILERLPKISQNLVKVDRGRLNTILKSLCAQWTIHARYSPQSVTMTEASTFLNQIKELKQWLK